MGVTTTLDLIRSLNPCHPRWRIGLRKVGGLQRFGPHTPIKMTDIVNKMGVSDAIFCTGATTGQYYRWRLLAVRIARMAEHLMPEDSRKALIMAEKNATLHLSEDNLIAWWRTAHRAWTRAIGTTQENAAMAAVVCAARYSPSDMLYEVSYFTFLALGMVAGSPQRPSKVAIEWLAKDMIRICEEDI